MYGEIGSQIGCLKMPSIFSTGYAIDSLLNCYKGKKNLKKKKHNFQYIFWNFEGTLTRK